jgi:hypothetical protein
MMSKRALSPNAERPQAARRKINNSSEDTTVPGVFSPDPTGVTVASPETPPPAEEKMATPAEDPAAYENYYYGLRGTPTLLARSNKSPWVRPEELLDDGYHSGLDWVRKEAYVITRHPIRQKLDSGLRDNIRRVLATMSPVNGSQSITCGSDTTKWSRTTRS